MDARTGTIVSPPHLPGMRGFPLGERLRADLSRPVSVHHDAAACALAEVRWGADRDARGLAYLTCGTGFGAGIVIDGRARYGSRGFSPEIGHVRYRDDGPDVFGKPGSFESYGSASALPKIARRYDPAYDAESGADVARRAAAGDWIAQAAIDDNADAVGAACALLADLLVLDVIVLGRAMDRARPRDVRPRGAPRSRGIMHTPRPVARGRPGPQRPGRRAGNRCVTLSLSKGAPRSSPFDKLRVTSVIDGRLSKETLCVA